MASEAKGPEPTSTRPAPVPDGPAISPHIPPARAAEPAHHAAPSAPDDDLASEDASFEALINQHLPGAVEEQVRGEVLEVPIVAVREENVLVDIGGKAEAIIRIEEFPLVGGQRDVAVGQVIKVVQVGRETDGSPRFSHREARAREAEEGIREALANNQPVRGRVTATVKGGVMVDIGLSAFMPASQVDLFKIPDLNTLVGQEVEAYVQEFDARRKRAVLSRRKLLFEQRENSRKATLDALTEGLVIEGKVKSALDFGVFLELGIIDGFIPREEVSYDRGTHPSELVKAGDLVQAKVIKIDRASGKVTLSRKRLQPDPWDTIEERYAVGQQVEGRVIAIQHYGAFVYLEEGVTGMIHAGDISWNVGNKKPGDFVNMGDTVTCQILELSRANKRLSLSLKHAQANPWAEVEEKFPRGTRVKGTVTSLTNYGAFIRLDEFIEGMIHVSDLTWERRINHPKEVLAVGQEVEAVVLKSDPDNKRLSLGIKQLAASPFEAFLQEHPVGTLVKGKVSRFAPFGAFVELAPGLEGLIHISQIDEKRVELPEKALELGQEIEVKIVKVEAKQQKISLSRKEAIRQAEKDVVRQFMKKTNDQAKESGGGGMTFGEALRNARKDGN